jgi:hypothetical protein
MFYGLAKGRELFPVLGFARLSLRGGSFDSDGTLHRSHSVPS